MTHDPSDPTWLGRDRFVLSCGHSSPDPVHPALPLRLRPRADGPQGAAHLGLADPGAPRGAPHQGRRDHHRPARLRAGLRGRHGHGPAPPARPARPRRQARRRAPFDHHVWVLASDGDLMEGVASEASSLAGHQELGNLTVIYDANQISIEDDTDISFSEDVAKRYEAYGWDVVDIDWRRSNDPAGTADYAEDVDALLAALEKSKTSRTKPTLVRLHTVIAWPAPTAGHRQVARLGARRRRGRRHQGAARLRPQEDLRGRHGRSSPTPARSRSAARPPTRRGTSATPRGARPTPSAPPCSTASSTARLPDGLREGPAGLPRRRQGHRDPRRIRQGARRPRRRAARAVGRLRRPRRVQQHDDGRRALVHPQGQADRTTGRAAPTGAPCTSASARTPWA